MLAGRTLDAQPDLDGAARWQLRLLGDVVLSESPHGVRRLPGRAATALLARLALAPDRSQSRELLVELLWPGVTLAVGRNRLRQLLSTLKHLLDAPGETGTVLLADRRSIRLQPGALHCDANAFEAALRTGRLDQARALYRGELLPGFYDDWIHDERLRLAALAERLTEPAAAPQRQPWPERMPAGPGQGLPERPRSTGNAANTGAASVALGLPHYLSSLHGAAGTLAHLRAELGLRRLLTLRGPGGHGKTRLAVELAHSLAAAGAAADPLAPTALADSATPHFDLLAFVPLVALAPGQGAGEAVLTAIVLALRQSPDHRPALLQLQQRLAGRRVLLVLDNFEHLVDDAAPAVADLLAACPGLHLLITSRRALGLDGEVEHELAPLPLPDLPDLPELPDLSELPLPPDPSDLSDPPKPEQIDPAAAPALAHNPAVAMLVDRARAVRASFRLSAHNRLAVAALVRQLQGMPLAIELAASRLRSLSPAALLSLLRDAPATGPHSGGALALLARSGPRAGGDPRHASMLAVIQWSWQLLSPEARRLLPQLTVFAGSFSLAAAAALADAPPAEVARTLDELVTQSMLRAAPDDDDQRYAMFELVREYAAAMPDAAAAAALRQRHRRWLTQWFGALALATPLQQVRPEMANLAAALLSAETDGEAAAAAALAAAAQGATSALSLPLPVLAALQRCADRLAEPVRRALLRANLSRAMLLSGQTAAADRLAMQAMAELPGITVALADAVAGDDDTIVAPGLARAQVLTRAAHVRWRLHRDAGVAAWLDEALALAAAAPALQAGILTNLGAIRRPADAAASVALQRRALALWAAAGDVQGVNVGRCNLALALLARRADAAEALELATQAAQDSRLQGDERQHALACNLRGEAWSRLGRWAEAAAAYRDCVAAAFAGAEPWPLTYGLWNLPRSWAYLRRPEAAARLMGFIEQHTPGVTGDLSSADRRDLRRLRRLCERQCDAAEVESWRQAGAALSLAQAVRLALRDAP